jgi:hypothetical protein
MSQDPAFQLQADGTHLGDDDFDATLVRFEGWEVMAGLIPSRSLEIREPVFFEANVETLRAIDYPINDVSWPIMSQRMRNVLLSGAQVAHREIQVIMLDDTVKPAERFHSSSKPRPGVGMEGFSAIQITAYTDAFDWERSEFAPHPRLRNRVVKVSKLVLKDMALPPLFRLSALPGPLFVTAAARAALEAEGIRELKFIPLDLVT